MQPEPLSLSAHGSETTFLPCLYPNASADLRSGSGRADELQGQRLTQWRMAIFHDGTIRAGPDFPGPARDRANHPSQLNGQPNAADFIDDTCLRCHGVMGERQYKIDTHGGLLHPHRPFRPRLAYGALARDGVSCLGCHHIAADGLGTEETYTGLFKVGPATELYGPYPK